jgi:HAD superfamily phosphatase (TIGR01668 family)
MRLLRATETAETIFDVDYNKLHALGKRALLFDLDRTLGKRGLEHVSQRTIDFLLSLTERGFKVGVLTNRKRNTGVPAMHTLRKHVPVVHAAGKPARRGFLRLLLALEASPAIAVMIGDRRLTDVLGANRLGIHSIRVLSRNTE